MQGAPLRSTYDVIERALLQEVGGGVSVAPEVHRSLPPYQQIADHYRDQIKRGELKDGDRLPSTRQIVDQWNVAHATAAKALTALAADGLVRTVPGGAGGTIVDLHAFQRSPRDRMVATRRLGKIYPEGEQARIVAAELVNAPEHIANALGIPSGSQVIRRHRVTYRGDVAVSASTSWFHGHLADMAPALLVTERIPQGTPGYIAQQTSRPIARGRDLLAAGTADSQTAADLEIPEGTPVLRGRNWVYDRADEVIEYGESTSLPDRWLSYQYELD